MEDDLKKNGRRPPKKMEDDLKKNKKWKRTSKKNEGRHIRQFKMPK